MERNLKMTLNVQGVNSKELQGKQLNKAQVPARVLTLGTDSKWKLDEQSTLGLGARESMENSYNNSPEEKIW